MQTEFDTIAAISNGMAKGYQVVRISGDDAIRGIADEVYRLKDKRLKKTSKSYDSLWAYRGSER